MNAGPLFSTENDVEARFNRENFLFIYYAIELSPVHAYFGNELEHRVASVFNSVALAQVS